MSNPVRSFAPPPAPPVTPRRILPLLLLVAGGAIVGVLIGKVLGRSPEQGDRSAADALLLIGKIFLTWFLAVAVHEAGHLLFAMRAGMKPILYVVGPLRLAREAGRFRVGLNRNLATWGGLASAIPPDLERLRERMMWLVAGGPLASLALAIVCGVLVMLGVPRTNPVGLLGVMSFAIFLVTMIPTTIGGFLSDGAQFLAFRRGGPAIEQRGLLILLAGASLSGQRPRELDSAVLNRALSLEGSDLGRTAVVLVAATVAVDRGVPSEELFGELAVLYPSYPDGFRQSIALWMAWYVAFHRGDADLAREWLKRGRGGIVDPALRDLAEAAAAMASGDVAAARKISARGLSRSPGMDPGTGLLIHDLLEQIRAQDRPGPEKREELSQLA